MVPGKDTLFQIAQKIRKGKTTSTEVVGHFLEQIQKKNPEINGFVTVDEAIVKASAAAVDKKISEGNIPGPLAGVPVAVKDNLNTRGMLTTCASKMLENYMPIYDACVIEKLRSAGAVILGKTNMDEFAMGSSTETSHAGPAKNPLDPTRIPGGSSGGSAAVVAAEMAAAALGSDTGGSIRQPAGCCGVVGLKPTYGRVSRYGLVAFASSLDQIGPITRDVRDAALLLKVISGQDSRDATSSGKAIPDFTAAVDRGVKGVCIGLPKEYFAEGLDPAVKAQLLQAVEKLKSLGAEVIETSLPHTEYAVAAYYVIATAEASSNLARYDGVKFGFRKRDQNTLKEMYENTRSEGFGAEVKRRIMLGTYVLSAGYYNAYYLKAQKVRRLICQDFENAFKKCDVLLSPTMPTLPFKLGEKIDDPLAMYLSDTYTISLNLAGLPGISVPVGDIDGLPAAAQVIGKAFDEETILSVGAALEN